MLTRALIFPDAFPVRPLDQSLAAEASWWTASASDSGFVVVFAGVFTTGGALVVLLVRTAFLWKKYRKRRVVNNVSHQKSKH